MSMIDFESRQWYSESTTYTSQSDLILTEEASADRSSPWTSRILAVVVVSFVDGISDLLNQYSPN
jgi:hypothetical protein